MAELTRELQKRIEALLRDTVVSAVAVSRGYTPAGRWLLTLRARGSVFVKVGTTAFTASALKLEARAYSLIPVACIPKLIAWEDATSEPLLVLEDLSRELWPPPWSSELIGEVRAALDALHESRVALQTFAEVHGDLAAAWQQVAVDPEPFLALGLASRRWLEEALPSLIRASDQIECGGGEVCHFDVRSDNICRTGRGIVFIDWNCACLGNGALDLGFWLPSLQAEGGPRPELILPDRPDVAACVSGYFAAHAGLPGIPDAPCVRAVQRQQLVPALHWAARELYLPEPHGSV